MAVKGISCDDGSFAGGKATVGDISAANDASTAAITVDKPQSVSIYQTWTRQKRAMILTVVSVSQFLNPLTSSVVLPSLKVLQHEFHTSNVVAAAIIACYFFPVGLSSLFWGPACDKWGRKSIYLASTTVYAASTVGCIFPSSIAMLLAFRAMQGVALGAYRGAGVGAIADIYRPDQRGLAIGIVMVSTLVGPVVGPLLGGFLTEAYGWRAPFYLLLVFSGVIIVTVVLLMSETHQYKTLQKLIKSDPAAVEALAESQQILSHKPEFKSPWEPISMVLERPIVLHLLVGLVGFSALVSTQTELPSVLSSSYGLTPSMIGVSMLPTGIAGIIFSPIGGKLFDRAAASNPGHPMLRLTYNNWLSLVGMPAGLLIWGWAAHTRTHLALVLVGLFCVGGSMCVYLPAFMGYLTCLKQHQASTAAAGQNALIFLVSGALVLAGSAITGSIGIGWYCTIMALLHLGFAIAAQVQIGRVRADKRKTDRPQQLPSVAAV